ncbi:MAG: nuclear transport factor 2 family protein [Planctomycetota bacterium]|jgi:uncharacterized protein (TIGR02246 family)
MTVDTEQAVSLELIDEITEDFNRHDVDAVVNRFADDGVFLLARGDKPWGRRLEGKDEIRAFLEKRFAEIPDMQWETISRWSVGNRAAFEWIVRATLPSGEKMELFGCDLYEFRGDKMVRKDTYWKSLERSL